MLPSEQLQASLDIHLLDATISIAGCTRVERGNGASPCSTRLMPACRMLLHAFTSLSFLHLRRCSTHSVDLHLMLRWRCPHFCASFWQPAHSVVVLCCVVFRCCQHFHLPLCYLCNILHWLRQLFLPAWINVRNAVHHHVAAQTACKTITAYRRSDHLPLYSVACAACT